MNREKCTLCDNESLVPIYSLSHYPLLRHSKSSFEDDKYSDLNFVSCKVCGCVQLQNLQDPNFLYKENNNQTFWTPTWDSHNKEFASFILSDSSITNLFEIGGLTCHLAQTILNERKIPYTILDICDDFPERDDIQFKYGNAEQYTFDNIDTIVMSHVFEHLYKPREFLDTLYKKGVKEIFISIPDMSSLLKKKIPLLINVEHTFYLNSYLCKQLFQSMGYKCVKMHQFLNHSLFFHFILDVPEKIVWDMVSSEQSNVETYFFTYKELNIVDLPDTVYIAPGGYYGQFLYSRLKDRSKVKGFLDNDKNKDGYRVYGTPLKIYHPSTLTESNVTILLSSSFYSDEIVRGFKKYLPFSTILSIDSDK
jgi:hypothetical protein